MSDQQHASAALAREAIVSRAPAAARASVARAATPVPLPSTWPPNSELRFVGRHHALRQLNGYLGAADRPRDSLLALAAQLDAELPLREPEPDALPAPCPGCWRCADRRRPTTPARKGARRA